MNQPPAPPFPRQRIAELLGYLGLVPFFGGALASLFLGVNSVLVLAVIVYGGIILSFMAGGTWLAGLQNEVKPAQILGIVAGLLSWVFALLVVDGGPVLVPLTALGIGASLLILFFAERRWAFWPDWYERLRRNLTVGAAAALVVVSLSVLA